MKPIKEMTDTERRDRTQEILNEIKKSPARMDDVDIVTDVMEISYALLYDIKLNANKSEANRETSKMIIQCYPKDSLKLELLDQNLNNLL